MLLTLASIAFITFGDWGSGTADQKAVAAAATQYCRTEKCEFVLALGDNFYENGVSSSKDSKWKLVYKDVYDDLNLPFYAILGNHDERGNVQAQIDYSRYESSWHMPARDYRVRFPQGSDTPLLEIFVINNGDREFQASEKTWLESALAKSKATWKILAMHIPIISNGMHGDNNAGINDELIPVICGKVDLVVSGHDHDFAYMKGPWKNCPITQFVVGTGGKEIRKVNMKDLRMISSGSFFGFGWFNVVDDHLDFRMIKTDGTVFYQTSLAK